MDSVELKKAVAEAVAEALMQTQAPPKKPRRMEFSKKLMAFASMMYTATWSVSVYSWFHMQIVPIELLQYATWLYAAALVSYKGKSAYENKPKIEKWGGGG